MTKFTLWNKEVELDYPTKESFISDEELNQLEQHLSTCQHDWMKSKAEEWLHCRKFLPTGEPKAVIVFCHGIQTHSGKALIVDGRKLSTALLVDHFVTKGGYALYCLDLLGHGFSEGLRAFVPDYKIHVHDLNAFVNQARADFPALPLFLLGHSYGTTLSIHVATEHWQDQPNFGGLMLLATATRGDLPPPIVVFVLADILAPCFPKSTPSFMPNPVSSERIWRDEAVLRINTGPLYRKIDTSGIPFRLGTAVALLNATKDVRNIAVPKLKCPFVAVHGTEDFAVPVTDVNCLEEQSLTPKDDQTVIRIPGAYHDLLCDPAAEETIKHLETFLTKRMEQLSSSK
jgi:acylglycerol lipase